MIQPKVKFSSELGKLYQRIKKKEKRVLYKQGDYLKTSIQRSMRYRKKASQPGKPPSAHRDGQKGAALRNKVRFYVDETAGSVIAGPEIFDTNSNNTSPVPVPELLDQGGDILMELKGRSVRAHIEPRPFTAPVFTDGGKNFAKLLEKEQL